jgi:hypothetical protein
LIARKTDHRDAVDELYGALELPASTDSLLDELRGPGPTSSSPRTRRPTPIAY